MYSRFTTFRPAIRGSYIKPLPTPEDYDGFEDVEDEERDED